MKENFTNAQSDPLVEAASKILSGQINENKKVTSEKSQFGGFRPKIINGDGSVFFLGSQAFKTPQGAAKAAQYYLDQYEKGVNTKNIKMMKGDYVKESELQEVTKGKLVDILKKEGWESMGMKDLDDAIRKAKVNTPLGDVIGAWSKADKIVLFYDDGTSDLVSLSDRKITSTKELWFGHSSKLREASNDLGTATIVAPGHKYHGKAVRVFHKFDDGRINVQYKKSDKKGDLVNLTLNKGQYKLDEETIEEKMLGFSHPDVTRNMLDIIDEFDARDVEALLKHMIDSFTYPDNEDSDIDLLVKNLKRTLNDWKNRSSKTKFSESTIAKASPKGNNLQKLNDISKIIADKEKSLKQLEKQRDLAQKEYDKVEADLYVLLDKRDELHDMLKDSNLGFSKSQIDRAYKGRL